MAFRSSEYLQRNEYVRFQLDDVKRAPANNQRQEKNGYRFRINNRSSFFDWYNGYFEVRFELQKLADGAGYAAADRITVTNGFQSHKTSYDKISRQNILRHRQSSQRDFFQKPFGIFRRLFKIGW